MDVQHGLLILPWVDKINYKHLKTMMNKISGPKEDEARRNEKIRNLCEPNFSVMEIRLASYYLHRSGKQEIRTEVS
jgi:hypothetical protein